MRKLLPLLLTCMQLSALWSPDDSWQPYLEVDGQWGNYRKGAGIVSWTPLIQDQRQLGFMQVRLGNFHSVWDGSIGFGYRSLLLPGLGVGVNLFGDYARSPDRTHYLQGGLGVELLGNCWLLRSNGYLATSRLREEFRRSSQVFIEELDIFSNDRDVLTRIQGYSGLDVEGGAGLDLCWGELWGYLSYYRYGGRHVPPIQGPRARVEWFWDNAASIGGSRVTFSAEWDYSRRHGNTISGYASIRFPLGTCNPPRGVCRLMSDPVIRERSIWVDSHDTVTRQQVDLDQQIIFVEQNGVGTGTQTDPTNLLNATGIAGPNDIIFLLQDNGDITAVQIIMQDGQQLYGFDSAQSVNIAVADGRTLTVDNFTGGAVPPVLDGTALGPIEITTANNNTIFGIDILNSPADAAILVQGNNHTIRRVNITNSLLGFGIDVQGANRLLIDQVNITNNNSDSGIVVESNSSNIDLRAITISGPVETVMAVKESSNISISGATLSGGTAVGLDLEDLTGTVNLASISLASTSGSGLTIGGGSANYTGLDSTVSSTAGTTALGVSGTSGTVNLTGFTTTATATSATAIDVQTNSGSVTLGTLSAEGDRALHVQNQTGPFAAIATNLETTGGNPVLELDNVTDANLLVTTLTSTGATAEGVIVKDTSGAISIANGSITGAAGTALEVDGGSPILSYTGSITNTVSGFIDIQNTTAGAITLVGSAPNALSSDGGDGLMVMNAASDVTLKNGEMKNSLGSGAVFQTTTGEILLEDCVIETHAINGITGVDVAELTLRGTTIEGATILTSISNTNIDGDFTVEQGCQFLDGQDGVAIINSGTGAMDFTCIDSTFEMLTANGLFLVQGGGGGGFDAAIGRCTIDDVATAIALSTGGSANNCAMACNISNNQIGATVPSTNALFTSFSSDGTGPVTVDCLFANNPAVATSGDALLINSSMMSPSDEVTLAFDTNIISSAGDTRGVAVLISNSGEHSISILDNQQAATAGASPGYEISTSNTPTVCGTILGNSSNQTTGIRLNNGGGTMGVTDLANLSTLNNGIPVAQVGFVTDLGSLLCPTPNVPTIPSGP